MEENKESGFSKVNFKQQNQGLKKFINDIYEQNNRTRVKKFAKEFTDGLRFLDLFNLLFDESVKIPFSNDTTFESKLQNWNKINALVCFNYLQQDFYLGASTMTTLAKGESADTLFHIIRLLLNSSQVNYDDAIVDEAEQADISDVLIRESSEAGMGTNIRFAVGAADPTCKLFLFYSFSNILMSYI